eukprot:m.26584 g.26584  ORF g.26584 m.26584 type:complete len:1203 (-) comp4326_c0_seq1:85-3693(-)
MLSSVSWLPSQMLLLLHAATVLASSDTPSQTSPCLGEYEETDNHECVLRANGGFADEPTGIVTPVVPSASGSRNDTVLTSENPMPLRYTHGFQPPKTTASGTAVCGLPTLTGNWTCGGVACTLAPLNASAFSVTSHGTWLWTSAVGTVQADGSLFLVFNLTHPGPAVSRTATPGRWCCSLAMSDGSTWLRTPCPSMPRWDVHIVAHTHDDTGYTSTVDEYYESNVRSILTTVTEELQKNPARRFTYVEMAFFERWWNEQSNATQAIVRKLVATGQLEFANGGWCMPDEASPTYVELLRNMQRGIQVIINEFGPTARPRVAWSIDPFGHSSAYAAMNAQFGFDMSVVGRIDWQEKASRFANVAMETVWRPVPSAPNTTRDIFTHVLDPIQFYTYPPGFSFEGDKRTWVTPANVNDRAAAFASFIEAKGAGYATESLMVPFGSDFQYTNASINYDNMDRLMAHVNANPSLYPMSMKWSTPGTYLDTMHAKATSWPLKVDDFESYAIGPAQFLVGFYSSRPDLKGMVRRESARLRAATIDLALAVHADPNPPSPTVLDWTAASTQLDVAVCAVSVVQHHDGITSTQRRHVHHDYIRMLSDGQAASSGVVATVAAARFAAATAAATSVPSDRQRHTAPTPTPPVFDVCLHLNMSVCPPLASALSTSANSSGAASATVVIQNPTSATRAAPIIRLPVPAGKTYHVRLGDGHTPLASQLLPPWPPTPHVLENGTLVSPLPMLAVQLAPSLSGLARTTLNIQAVSDNDSVHVDSVGATEAKERLHTPGDTLSLQNKALRVDFDATTGMLASITRLDGPNPVTVNVTQELMWYNASTGADGPWAGKGATGSGNYIFQPAQPNPYPFVAQPNISAVVGDTLLVQEVRISLIPGKLEQVFRLVAGGGPLEIDYRLGPIDISDGYGHEVISRFTTNLASNDAFATDGNGEAMVTRTRNQRATLWPNGGPSWFNCTESVACNYFATSTAASIQDNRARLTVLPDRGQGATSMAAGQLELMVHRRLTHGCRWGMCEGNEQVGLNDTLGAEVVVRHVVSVDAINADGTSLSTARQQSRELNFPLEVLVHPGPTWPFAGSLPGIAASLPDNVEVTTLEATATGVLLRLTHIYPPGEHPTLSQPVSVSLTSALPTLAGRVKSITEMLASGDLPLDAVQRMQWSVRDEPPAAPSPVRPPPTVTAIELNAGETRTFTLAL